MQAGSGISLSPSFNSYSNSKFAEIAARVAGEFPSEEYYDEFYFGGEEDASAQRGDGEEEKTECGDEDESEEEFEFAFATRDSELSSLISADEIFQNGRIRPVYPVFNSDLFLRPTEFQKNGVGNGLANPGSDPTIRLPLRKLFIEERETTATAMNATTSSCSSSEADDLDGVPADTYCVWRPKEAKAAAGCKKSSSAGANSKRWKFKDLLNRSHSEGSKESFVFLSTSNSGRKKENEERVKATPGAAGKVKAAPPPRYARDGGEKRRSYLPYKQDLVGFFGNVNGMSKNLQPF